MGTNDVRVDQKLNKAVWSQGVRFVAVLDVVVVLIHVLSVVAVAAQPLRVLPSYSGVAKRIRVRFERKRNEDEDAKEKLYTLVSHVPVSTFKGVLR